MIILSAGTPCGEASCFTKTRNVFTSLSKLTTHLAAGGRERERELAGSELDGLE